MNSERKKKKNTTLRYFQKCTPLDTCFATGIVEKNCSLQTNAFSSLNDSHIALVPPLLS